MRVDPGKCIGCGRCFDYCTMRNVFRFVRDRGRLRVETDEDECVECGVCLRADACPTGALYMPELGWPRSLRNTFSDPMCIHKVTRIPGRGTEEMKTNDVTGRYRRGCVGIGLELGRPGTGARFRDVQRMAEAVAPFVTEFEPRNPVTALMSDKARGLLDPAILDEKVLSAIVEATAPAERLEPILGAVARAASTINTVVSVELISRTSADGSVPVAATLERLGVPLSMNGKNNVGLGRPLAGEE